MLKRLAVIAALLPVAALGLTAPPAFAGTGDEYCLNATNSSCVNAWNGGPFIKLATSLGAGPNNDFTEWGDGNGHVLLQFTGGGSWNGRCIGDAYNDPGHADASLDSCGSPIGTNPGWGTLFVPGSDGCAPGRVYFRNVHWGGYLGPQQTGVSGSPFYLNKGSKFCYNAFPPQ